MSRSGLVARVFVGEGHYDLHLRISELIALQEKMGVGPFVVAQRLANGEWLVQDVTEVIRLALIGGGMTQKDAFDLVQRSIISGTLSDYAAIATNAILAAIMGVEDEPIPGEAAAPVMPTD